MRFIPLLALHSLQVLLSLDASYHSYLAIQALRKFEGTAKKAAKISNEAAEQLRRTRSTEIAGAAAIAVSLASSLYINYVTFVATPSWVTLVVNLVLIGVLMAARVHMLNFWEKQRPIPVVAGAYNEGLDRSEKVTSRLSWLEITWLTSTLVTAWYVRPYAGRI